MNVEIMMRPSIVSKLVGTMVCAGLSIYNIASSSDQVLIRSANPSSSRTEVRVFESPSKHLNMTSGAVFGLFGCGLVFFAFNEYNNILEELGNECATQEEGHPQEQVAPNIPIPPPIPQSIVGNAYVQSTASNIGKHLRLVPPMTADGTTMPGYLIPPKDFIQDMEAVDYWDDSLNKE
jgi:hypothetical protein